MTSDLIELGDLLPPYLKIKDNIERPQYIEIYRGDKHPDPRQIFYARFSKLDIEVPAASYEDLLNAVEAYIAFTWGEIATESDQNLTDWALDLKKRMNIMLEEVEVEND